VAPMNTKGISFRFDSQDDLYWLYCLLPVLDHPDLPPAR
jgi:hypothetical protein